MPLPTTTSPTKTRPMRIVRQSTSASGSMRSPMETRNAGMKMLEPTKSIRSMSSLFFGTIRFSPIPARKAPMMPAMPPTTAMVAAAAIAASTNSSRCTRE